MPSNLVPCIGKAAGRGTPPAPAVLHSCNHNATEPRLRGRGATTGLGGPSLSRYVTGLRRLCTNKTLTFCPGSDTIHIRACTSLRQNTTKGNKD